MHITICICTFQRAALLKKLLTELNQQTKQRDFSFSVVVADNDRLNSARGVVAEVANQFSFQIVYCQEPRQNIALARNKALEYAYGDLIAFIDDDEYPAKDWLLALYKTCVERKVDGVLGPVIPHFEREPPVWVRKGKFYDRPSHPTGFVMNWQECRTGNVLFRRDILQDCAVPFQSQFGNGSEDVDFFRRMVERGHIFIWCNEAVVYETVAPSRWKRSFMLKRGLLRGANSLKHPSGRWKNVVKSMIATPLYIVTLPLLFLMGQHYFMKYCIKLCDHIGRLSALLGLSLIRHREM